MIMNCFKKKSVLLQEDLDYLIENTRYKENEVKEWYTSFMKDFPKGHITEAKFADAFKMIFPHGNAEQFCKQVFSTFDLDGKGGIDFKEFVMAMDSNKTAQDKLKWAFKLYDIDGDGCIDLDEMSKTVEAIYDMLAVKKVTRGKRSKSVHGTSYSDMTDSFSAKYRAEDIFNRLDENGDGFVTEDEFLRGCLQDDELRKMLEPDVGQ